MEIILSLKEAIMMKGNASQIKAFNENGNLKTNPFNSIMNKFNEEYARVEVIGKGKNREILLADKRLEPIKLDKRQNNKAEGKKTKFASQLELLIIKALRDSHNRSVEGSIGSVMSQMKMANNKLCYYKQPNRINQYVKRLEENEINISKEFLVHVLDKEHDVLTGALLTALENLRKKKFLKWSKYPIGVQKIFNPEYGEFTNEPAVDENNSPMGYVESKYITLTHEQTSKLAEIERNLKTKHNVTFFQIINYPYSEKVTNYEKELKHEFSKLGIDYYFDSFSIRLVAQEKEVDEQLKDNEWMIEENYVDKYFNYGIEKAQKRQDDYLNKNHGFGEILAPVKKELSENVYVHEYEKTMKHSVLPKV